MARPYRPVRYRTKTEKFSEQPYNFGRGDSYYEDARNVGGASTITSGTEGGPGGGTSSTRQSDIEMIGPTAENVYGASRKRRAKVSGVTSNTHLDSRGRFITKL